MRILFKLSPWLQQRQFEKSVWVFPAHLAMFATYLRDKGNEVVWDGKDDDTFDKIITDDVQIDVPFEKLPFPDRVFTNGKDPRTQSYGNFKFRPNTHMMASNLCWYGKCTFCIDTEKLQSGEKRGVRSVAHVIEEIDDLIRLGYKEVFDDSGTLPVGEWLSEFCREMNKPPQYEGTSEYVKDAFKLFPRNLNQPRKNLIKIGCNMKPVKIDYKMMANAGFRFILVGIESANQQTINKIQKGQRSADIIPIIKSMSDAGLEPHGTFMTGYPWETWEDEKKTIELCHYLLRKGYLKTAQASVYSPPRTKPDPNSSGHRYLPRFYDVYKNPEFLIQKVKDIRRWEDFTYLLRGARLVIEEKVRKTFR